jgi:hypothetical protein
MTGLPRSDGFGGISPWRSALPSPLAYATVRERTQKHVGTLN